MDSYNAEVALVMGSKSDWKTLEPAAKLCEEIGLPLHVEVVSAHRTPKKLATFAETAEERGLKVIIAAAGGAAHLPGMLAAHTLVPVIGVPVEATPVNGLDALLSIVQMPKGTPVATMAIGTPGAINGAFMAAQIISLHDPELKKRLAARRQASTDDVLANPDPRAP